MGINNNKCANFDKNRMKVRQTLLLYYQYRKLSELSIIYAEN